MLVFPAASFARLRRMAWIAVVSAFGALAGIESVGTVAAQPLAVDVARYSVAQLVVLAQNARDDGRCRDFQTILDELDERAGTIFRVRRTRTLRLDTFEAGEAARALRADPCPRLPSYAAFAAGFGWSSSFGGPKLQYGTKILGPNQETFIAESKDLKGTRAGAYFAFPMHGGLGDTLEFFYFNSRLSGKAFGYADNAAITYARPNPISGSTGIAGFGPAWVKIGAEAKYDEFVLALKKLVFKTDVAGQPTMFWVKYGSVISNTDTEYRASLRTLFPSLYSKARFATSEQIYGGLLGAHVNIGGAGTPSVFAHLGAEVKLGYSNYDQLSKYKYRCGVCGVGSPEARYRVSESFSESGFAWDGRLLAAVGVKVNPQMSVMVYGEAEYRNVHAPFVRVSPNDPPSGVLSGTQALYTVGGAFRFTLSPQVPQSTEGRIF